MTYCDRITKEAKDAMFRAIEQTQEDYREHFLKLCEDKDKNIVPSDICVGIYCMVSPRTISEANCPNNTSEIGNFHTHPGFETRYSKPSKQDIVAAAATKSKMFCIGHSKSVPNKVENDKWIEKNKSITDCYDIKDKRLLELGDTAYEATLREDAELRDKIVEKMFSRLEELEYPSNIEDVINKKCSLTETKTFEYTTRNRQVIRDSKRLTKVIRKENKSTTTA